MGLTTLQKKGEEIIMEGMTWGDYQRSEYDGDEDSDLKFDCVHRGGTWVPTYRKRDGTKIRGYCRDVRRR